MRFAKVFLFLFILISISDALKKKGKEIFHGEDYHCLRLCLDNTKLTETIKLCGVVSKSCCAGTCLVGVCFGTRLSLDC